METTKCKIPPVEGDQTEQTAKKLRILILEDTPADAELAEREMCDAGIVFSSRSVQTKEGFLKGLKDFSPDLVLADYTLPRFDGLHALQLLQEHSPSVPLIIVTGTLSEETAVDCIKAGAADYIIKEHLVRLSPAVKGALEKKRAMEEKEQAEKTLQISEQKFRTLVSNIPGVVYRCTNDPNLPLQFISNEVETLVGYPAYDFTEGKIRTYTSAIHPDDRKMVDDVLQKSLNSKEPFDIEYRVIHKDGSIKWICEKGQGVFGSKGQLLWLDGVIFDISERRQAAEEVKVSLREKEMLLREIHHRVKNNMQVISSLLRLQSRTVEDEKSIEIFKESQNRIRSMALVHEKLYHSKDLSGVDFKDYIKELANGLVRFYGVDASKIALKIDVKKVSLGINSAISCGLLINELISNSLKYAFPEGASGEIKVFLRTAGENDIKLKVSDNGVGMPEDLDFRKSQSLGLQLVTTLVEDQLAGKIELNRNGGTEFKITFKRNHVTKAKPPEPSFPAETVCATAGRR